jgi:putative SbcD/Mre11-related phosphoesterase
MKLLKNKKKVEKNTEIRFLQDSLLIDNAILVLGDLHIGYEEYITKSGIFPRMQFREIIEKLNSIFWDLSMEGRKIKKVIILGDLKHEFSQISDVEWSETLKFLDYLDEKIVKNKENKKISSVNANKSLKNERIILIKGNHDTILGSIAKKRDVKLVDYYKYKEICFMHGDKLQQKCFEKSKTLIFGHLHPAITLFDDYKKEKYKCFLKGKWKNKRVYVIPSFSPISMGYDLNSIENYQKDEFLIIKNKELLNFEVIIYNNKEQREYNFGKLRKLVY